MTIDERLEKLAERHEALTQTVEIIAAMHREGEARMAHTDEALAKLTAQMGNLTETMNRLANIVIRHEERLDAMDGGSE